VVPRRSKTRVYAREYADSVRYWGDFRDFTDVGGKREPLVPKGASYATDDPDLATELAAEKVKAYEKKRRSKTLTGLAERRSLKAFSAHHLEAKAAAGRVTDRHLSDLQHRLQRAVDFFGPTTPLDAIGTADVRRFLDALAAEGLAGGTRRHYMNALSNLYRRALSEDVALRNPARDVLEKPSGRRSEARWMEVDEAAVFLETARRLDLELEAIRRKERKHPPKKQVEIPVYPIVAAFLLTGLRRSELYGLDSIEDVSFDAQVIRVRPNEHRRVKTRTSRRVVPLWPQLAEILAEHVDRTRHRGGLLFRSARTKKMITDERKALDVVTARARRLARDSDVTFRFAPGEVRTKVFRHTYCAARLQTLDRGHPVSTYTVARELGHGSTAMVERVYAHLGSVRHRAEVVEYRLPETEGAKA